MRHHLTLLVISALASVAPLAAQSAARTPAAVADSVARLDTVELRWQYGAAPPAGSAAGEHVRFGIVALRVYELTGEESARRAAERAFDRAKDMDAGLAWAHYGYGVALARAAGIALPVPVLRRIVLFQSLGELVGLDPVSRAQRSLRRALQLEPGLEPAAVELGRIALQTHGATDLEEAATVLRRLMRHSGATARGHAMLARIETVRGDAAAALEAARAGVALAETAETQRVLALAMLLDPSLHEAGFDLYLSASARALADSDLMLQYEQDLASIATPEEWQQWAALDVFHRAVWLRTFWESRAHESVRTPGDRLAEHFRRQRIADAHYRRSADVGARHGDALLPRGVTYLPYDDRGLVFIRWGEPDTMVSSPPGRDHMPPPNVTWVYYQPGGPLAFNFFKLDGSPDWLLADPPRCEAFYFAYGTRRGLGGERLPGLLDATAGPGVEAFARYYEDRLFLRPQDIHLVHQCRNLVRDVQGSAGGDHVVLRGLQADADQVLRRHQEIERYAARDVYAALRTEDATPDYAEPLPILTSVYSFRGDSLTDVTAAVLVPLDVFRAVETSAGSVYPLRILLALRDSTTGALRRVADEQNFVARQPLPRGRYMRTMLHVPMAPVAAGDFRLRVENAGSESQGQVQGGPLRVLDFTGTTLQVSDIVVAEAEGGRLQRGVTTISPIPTHQVETGRTFRIFYELYNLPEDTPYRTRILIEQNAPRGVLERLGGLFGGRRSIDLRFDDVAAAPAGKYGQQQVRTVGAELAPAAYRLTITVENLRTGEVVTRSTPLTIIPVQDTG